MTNRNPLPLAEPEQHGFLYLGFHADKPQKSPLYQWSPSRRQAAEHLTEAATKLDQRDDVHSVRVFRAHLIPPLPGTPRHDLAMLIRTPRPEDLDQVRNSDALRALGGSQILAGTNAARIGETEADQDASFLFNHFIAPETADPLGTWVGLTNWYTSTVGVDNSTALRPVGDETKFALINYVRLPSEPLPFLLNQLLRPSFHRRVRGELKSNHMRALPGFYRMIR